MNINPANPFSHVRFYTLAGVSKAFCEEERVAGEWSDYSAEVRSRKPGALAEEYANWPDAPESILKFTRRYGPLQAHRHALGRFQFSLEQWRDSQRGFRRIWEAYSGIRADELEASVFEVEKGEQLIHRKSGLEYKAYTLHRLLLFDLASIPVERLRKCARPDCPRPYFVARHLKQNYCSERCAAWGQSQWKRKWWAEHGEAWRANRLRGKPKPKPKSKSSRRARR